MSSHRYDHHFFPDGGGGNEPWSRPEREYMPARSDTVLITSTEYDDSGFAWKTTDSMGVVFLTYRDLLGRTTKTIENYLAMPIAPTPSQNKTTDYQYGPAGLKKIIAWQGGIGQETEYVYGVTIGGGSFVNSNDIVGLTKWPDPTTGESSDDPDQQETAKVNALGQVIEATDRNGTTHVYIFDVLGRLVSDAVTAFGEGVDDAVQMIARAYDAQGNLYLITSYDAVTDGSIVNQVRRGFNGFGQVTDEWQEIGAAVDTGTSPRVQYVYSELDGSNRSRLVGMIYPSGHAVDYNYDSGLDNIISRLSSISDENGTLESYGYLGAGSILVRTNGAGVVHTTTLDDLGRVESVTTSKGMTLLDGYAYTYDRNNNRLTRTNLVDSDFDEAYEYDALNQLKGFVRDTLEVGWDYDSLGNRTGVTTDDGGGPDTVDWSANAQNQITGIEGATAPTYDKNGNMTGDETGRIFVYDAWNRLVQVQDEYESPLKSYGYDGMGRRVTETAGATTTDLYYSANWQVLEKQVGGETVERNVWSPVYVDALVLRERATTTPGTLDERLWVIQDANWNVTAVTNDAGEVVERYAYDPYGARTVYEEDWDEKVGGNDFAWTVGFQGMEWDEVVEGFHVRARWYKPSMGVWMSVDFKRFAAGDVNLMRFVGNNPVNGLDPSGLQTLEMQQLILNDIQKKLMEVPEAKELFDAANKIHNGKLIIVPVKGLKLGAQFANGQIQIDLDKLKQLNNGNLDQSFIAYYIMIETANALYDNNYANLDKDAKSGKIANRDDFAKQKETIEFSATIKAYAAAQAVIKAKKFNEKCSPDKPGTLEEYLKKQEDRGHTKEYREQYDKLTKKK